MSTQELLVRQGCAPSLLGVQWVKEKWFDLLLVIESNKAADVVVLVKRSPNPLASSSLLADTGDIIMDKQDGNRTLLQDTT